MEREEEFEWISVGELAKRIGKSTQSCYNYIKQGLYEHITFERGQYKGILVKIKKQ